MDSKIKIGIVICDRYQRCAGGKCFRAMRNREGAFSIYTDTEVELVGFTTCDGCPGGNIEYAGKEMVNPITTHVSRYPLPSFSFDAINKSGDFGSESTPPG